MGLEIWTTGDWSDCSPDLQKRLKYDHDVGVEWLTKYADIARAAQLDGGQGEGLKRCAAGRDGECNHKECPQLRDNEPLESGRHCPLDQEGSESNV